jgi:hypothetical protein
MPAADDSRVYFRSGGARQVVSSKRNQPEISPLTPRLDAAMQMGAAAPKDILFLVNVTPAVMASKAKGEEPLPKDNFLDKRYRR